MITDQKQLEVTQEQLQRLELALAELRRSASEGEFRSQTPSVIEHIRRSGGWHILAVHPGFYPGLSTRISG